MKMRPWRWSDAAQATLWLAASVLLIRRNSLWTPVAMAALVLWVTELRRRGRPSSSWVEPPEPPAMPPPSDEVPVISAPPSRRPWRPMFHLVLAGMLINCAMLAEGTERAVAAGLFVAGAAAIVVRRLSREQVEVLNRVSVTLALLLIFFGTLRWGAGHFLTGDDGGAEGGQDDRESNQKVLASTRHLSFTGVILFPARRTEVTTPPPPPPMVLQLKKDANLERRPKPLIIPFTGVYWMFHRPDFEPPKTAVVRNGSPDDLFFRAADLRPLVMEAHQHLGRHVDLACCAYVDVEITNVDRFPETVHLELIASDTSYPSPLNRRLGTQPVRSTEKRLPWQEPQVRPETLRFAIPAVEPNTMKADRLTVRFLLGGVRNMMSARMAIQRFTLLPRGGLPVR